MFKKYVKRHANFCKKNKRILESFLDKYGFRYVEADGSIYLFVKVSTRLFGKYWQGKEIKDFNLFGARGLLYEATDIAHIKGRIMQQVLI